MKSLAVSFAVVTTACTAFVAVAVVALEATDTMPWWTERRPWEAVEIDEDRIIIDFRLAGDCEKPDVPALTETEGKVHISGRVKVDLMLVGGICQAFAPWPSTVEVILDDPLGNRRLSGCTWALDGTEPADIDCRNWP